jgi:putative transposase
MRYYIPTKQFSLARNNSESNVTNLPLKPTKIKKLKTTPSYKRHCYPKEIIEEAVWLNFCFALSYREVELMLARRGIVVTYETIRQWCFKFGQAYANELKRRRPRPGDKWHLDEVYLKIKGKTAYLWRAVDQNGLVIDILVQSRRDSKAAKKFFMKRLKGLAYVPRVIITDKLKSYGAAKKEILASVGLRLHTRLNNRAENSHQPTRVREKVMRRFKSPGHAQRFLSAHGPIRQHFRPRRHTMKAAVYRTQIQEQFKNWQEVTALKVAA